MGLVRKGRKILSELARAVTRRFGYDLVRVDSEKPDIKADAVFAELYKTCAPYTMTSVERMYALYQAVQYIVSAQVPGAIVECGVWRGGSCMLAALVLKRLGDMREIWLYDTFEGMTEPLDLDIRFDGKPAQERWNELGGGRNWCYASLEEVQENMRRTGYPSGRLVFVKGRVEETLRERVPEAISLLRLDTDLYASTLTELEVLFPLLSPRGVLIVDDYGHWRGSRRAVEEYFRANAVKMLLHRIDSTGRIGVRI